jgi:Spy/CpxP family protein refolding chaperone
MKKILKAAVIILVMAVSGTGVWADQTGLTQTQIDQIKANHKAGHPKRHRTHKVSGQAVRGANQVSPKPMEGNH